MTSLKFYGIFCVIGDILRRLWFCFRPTVSHAKLLGLRYRSGRGVERLGNILGLEPGRRIARGKRFVLLRIFHPFFVFALAFLWMAAIAAEEGKFFLHQSNSPKKRIERIGFAVVGRQLFLC